MLTSNLEQDYNQKITNHVKKVTHTTAIKGKASKTGRCVDKLLIEISKRFRETNCIAICFAITNNIDLLFLTTMFYIGFLPAPGNHCNHHVTRDGTQLWTQP